ncbi:MAG: phosphate acetyltransferase [Candidatus Kapabacteria bacterium]|nr:phosphate acetyltransferase [Candidatus Kapabacteria bacterium]
MDSYPLKIRKEFHSNASQKASVIAFPDCEDVRVLHAVSIISKENIATPILVGNANILNEIAEKNDIDINGIKIVNPIEQSEIHSYGATFFDLRKTKGMTEELAFQTMKNPLFYAGMMLRKGAVTSVVAGAKSSTGDVLRAAIQTVGLAPSTTIVSSYFVMILASSVVLFSDCGVVPDPNSQELVSIASSTVENFKRLFPNEVPKVAFLSFSTKGSATSDSVVKVQEAFELFHQKHPNVLADGELQFDAAFVPEIAKSKAKNSPMAGEANIFIFPNLDAGNIAYKIAQRIGSATAIGPIIQGLNKPYCDLSRGCSVDDIIDVASISSLLSS